MMMIDTCTSCGILKRLAKHSSKCNECIDIIHQERLDPLIRKWDGMQPETLTCKICGEEKHVLEFSYGENEYGYRHECKECCKVLDNTRYHRNSFRMWAQSSLHTHASRGYTIYIKLDDLIKRAKNTNICPYCGIILKWDRGLGLTRNSPSVDRIDNGNTMTMENTEIICYKCNTVKNDRTRSEFVEYCKGVVERRGYLLNEMEER